MRSRPIPRTLFTILAAAALTLAGPPALRAQGTNIARGKPASQSSTPYGSAGGASAAVDGDTNGDWNGGSVSHTDTSAPWWQVDLGGVYDVSMIRIWNRTDCCRERLRGFHIMASESPIDASDPGGRAFVAGPQSFGDENSKEFRAASPVRARYVRIFLDHDDYLSLAEVEVFGASSGGGEQVPIKGANVGYVRYPENGGGEFQSLGGGRWREVGTTSGANFHFAETSRDEWSVYLNDDSRHLAIQLDLWQKKIYLTPAGGARSELYSIAESGLPRPADAAADAPPPAPVQDLGSSDTPSGTPRSGVPCPAGFTAAGPGVCNKPAPYGRAPVSTATPVFLNRSRALDECRREHPEGCELVGGMLVPSCKAGYHAQGPALCVADCPTGWTDLGVACKQPDSWAMPSGDPTSSIDDPAPANDPDVRYEDVPYMNPGDLDKILRWVEAKAIGAKLPFCWRDTYNDPGHTVSSCPQGTEPDRTGGPLSLCYPPCRDGYDGSAFNCTRRCPPGFTDNGIGFCLKPQPYGRGAGTIPTPTCPEGWAVMGVGAASWCGKGLSTQSTTKSCPAGEEFYSPTGLCYPKCKPDFHAVGSNICSPDCPPGYGEAGISCTRDNYTRGAGVPRTCAPGDEQDGPVGLCYPPSKPGYHRVGPTYWQNCESGWTDCGAGCQKNSDPILGVDVPWKDCASTIVDQVSSVVVLAANIATLGLAAPETEAAHAGEEVIKVGGKVVAGTSKGGKALVKVVKFFQTVKPSEGTSSIKIIRRIYNPRTKKIIEKTQLAVAVGQEAYSAEEEFRTTFSQNFADETSPEIDAKINAEFSPGVASFIKRSWAGAQLSRMASTEGWEVAQTVLSAASIADPTGITAVIEAYAKPICQPDVPFPTLAGYYK